MPKTHAAVPELAALLDGSSAGELFPERAHSIIKHRTRVVGILPNDPAITGLVGAVLLEQHEHWQLEGRGMFSAESMVTIPELPDTLALQAAGA